MPENMRSIQPKLLISLMFLVALATAYGVYVTLGSVHVLRIVTTPVDVPIHVHSPEDTHYDHMVWAKGSVTIPEDMWVTGITADVDGAPDELLHNAYLFIKDSSDPWCTENPRYIWSGGTVSIRVPTVYEAPYGTFLKKGDELVVEAALHNGNPAGTGEDYSGVTFAVELRYETAHDTTRSSPLLFSMIDPTGCNRHRPIFTIPPDVTGFAVDSKSHPFTFKEDAEIIRAAGHFHGAYTKGAKNVLRIFRNSELVDEFTTTSITEDSARNPRLLENKTPFSVKAGDTFTMEALFDNPSDSPVPEGMAIVGFYYVVR